MGGCTDLIDRQYINEVANIVRKQLQLEPPITLDKILEAVERLGGRYEPVEENSMNVEAQISTPKVSEDYEFIIKYLQGKSENRVLFSVAHELGHLVLHLLQDDGTLEKSEVYARSKDSSQKELEANEFAAALLMPENDFIAKCKEFMVENKVNVTKVAEYFNVSNQAATVRGNVLKLW